MKQYLHISSPAAELIFSDRLINAGSSGKVAVLSDADGRHVQTFDDAVDLLQTLPSLDPHYSCTCSQFWDLESGRVYDLAWELDDALDAVRMGGRWWIDEVGAMGLASGQA